MVFVLSSNGMLEWYALLQVFFVNQTVGLYHCAKRKLSKSGILYKTYIGLYIT